MGRCDFKVENSRVSPYSGVHPMRPDYAAEIVEEIIAPASGCGLSISAKKGPLARAGPNRGVDDKIELVHYSFYPNSYRQDSSLGLTENAAHACEVD